MFLEESEGKRDVLGTFKYASGIWFDSATLINTKSKCYKKDAWYREKAKSV